VTYDDWFLIAGFVFVYAVGRLHDRMVPLLTRLINLLAGLR